MILHDGGAASAINGRRMRRDAVAAVNGRRTRRGGLKAGKNAPFQGHAVCDTFLTV
jgi:hypothetical protein